MKTTALSRQKVKTHTPLTRAVCYVFGMLTLAVGLTLTAETRLGASALTAIPFVVSLRFPISFANATLILFSVYVAIQLVLKRDRRTVVPTLLQLPLSILFTRVMHVAQGVIDVENFPFPARLGFLALAIVFTGTGAAMTLKMKLIPNPGDGFVQTLAEKSGKPLGTMKNIVDIISVCTAALLSLLFMGRLEGVGIGSVMAMLSVGRVIALYNNLTKKIQLAPQPQEPKESEEIQHEASYKLPYENVESDTYRSAIPWAVKMGLIGGEGSTSFDYDGTVTREEFALMLYKRAGSPETKGTLDVFLDKGKVSGSTQKALQWAVEKGIILGKNDSVLDPAGAVSRAEAATMLERYGKLK